MLIRFSPHFSSDSMDPLDSVYIKTRILQVCGYRQEDIRSDVSSFEAAAEHLFRGESYSYVDVTVAFVLSLVKISIVRYL